MYAYTFVLKLALQLHPEFCSGKNQIAACNTIHRQCWIFQNR